MAVPLVYFLRSTSKLLKMCIEDTLRENYQETLDEFEEAFETVYELLKEKKATTWDFFWKPYTYAKESEVNFPI